MGKGRNTGFSGDLQLLSQVFVDHITEPNFCSRRGKITRKNLLEQKELLRAALAICPRLSFTEAQIHSCLLEASAQKWWAEEEWVCFWASDLASPLKKIFRKLSQARLKARGYKRSWLDTIGSRPSLSGAALAQAEAHY
eukprot:6491933-Amphidinium_carterae.1